MFKNELLRACANGETLKVQDLLKKDNSVTYVNDYSPSNGITAVQYASTNGYLDIVKILVENGARIDQMDKTNKTSLFKASLSGHPSVVQYLLSKGSLINRQDLNESTPLFAACESLSQISDSNNVGNTTSTTSSLSNDTKQKIETIKLLLNSNASIDIKNSSGKTPLMMASKSGIPELVQLLINHNSNPNIKDHLDLSSFEYANNNQTILKILKKELVIDLNHHNSGNNSTDKPKCNSCKSFKSNSKYCSFCGNKHN